MQTLSATEDCSEEHATIKLLVHSQMEPPGEKESSGGKDMTSFLSKRPPLENRLIGNILKEYPRMGGVMKRHFGGHRLERPGFKIQTLGMACILSGVDRKRLFKELEDFQN